MILVDELFTPPHSPNWRYPKAAHMMTDDHTAAGLDELHAMAARIGLKRAWFQHHNPAFPHYDLTASKRAQALKAGAEAVSAADMIKRCRRDRGEKPMSSYDKMMMWFDGLSDVELADLNEEPQNGFSYMESGEAFRWEEDDQEIEYDEFVSALESEMARRGLALPPSEG